MYQVAREYTRSAQLDRENQLLAVESRRYTELRTYICLLYTSCST